MRTMVPSVGKWPVKRYKYVCVPGGQEEALAFMPQDGLPQEELSTYMDEVFEAVTDLESDGLVEGGDTTGGVLDRGELERSRLML